MKISEMITDRYKLRIPPTVYYDLLADVQEVEEEQGPKFIAKSDGTIEQIKDCNNCILSQKTGHRDNIHIPDLSNCKWIFDFNNEVNRTIIINTAFLATLADRVDILERKLAEYERNTRKPY